MKYKKIKALVSIIVGSCQDESFGVSLTKLYKIFYFIDFGHYALHEESVSGFQYLRFKFGPVPKGLHDYLSLLEDDRTIDRRKVNSNFGEHEVFELYPNSQIEKEHFTDKEIATIEKTLAEFKHKSAATASRETHYQSPWITTGQGEIIPLELAKFCDFEWLGHFYDDKSKEDIKEIKETRKMLKNDNEFQALWRQVQEL